MITPAQAAAKLGAGIRNGQQAYQNGVNAVTQNPASKAISRRSKWVQAMANPEVHDRWQAGLEKVTLQDWKNAAANVGAQRFSQSADKAQSNYQTFANDFFPFLENVKSQLDAMPDVTQEERIQKAVAAMRMIGAYNRP